MLGVSGNARTPPFFGATTARVRARMQSLHGLTKFCPFESP
jgi:hypothetical protein